MKACRPPSSSADALEFRHPEICSWTSGAFADARDDDVGRDDGPRVEAPLPRGRRAEAGIL
jgi:hypothetical protein